MNLHKPFCERKKELEHLIAQFNEVAKDVTALDANMVYIIPRLKKHVKVLANLLESIQRELEKLES